MSVFDPYRFHGDEEAVGAKVDFAVNVRGTKPPEWLQRVLIDAIGDLADYPAAADEKLARKAVAELHQVPEESVLLVAGSAEAFALLPKLRPRNVDIVHPGFTEPNVVFSDAGIPVNNLILPAPFELDLLVDRGVAEMVIIGNPTNPTGVLHAREDLIELGAGRILVVDEAFLDVSDESESLAQVAAERGDVIVLRSFTKTWAIAGLRCGYVIAHPSVVGKLTKGRPHWALGTLQLRAIAAIAMSAGDDAEKERGIIAAERATMTEALGRAGFEIASATQAPYVLVRPPGEDAEALRHKLKVAGIAVRRCDTFPGLDESYWRLAVRPANQVAKLLKEL